MSAKTDAFYNGFTRLSTNNIVLTLVLQGCPRKITVFHWFCKLFRGQPHGHGIAGGEGAAAGGTQLPRNSPSITILSPFARPHSFASPRPLAHANETQRFPGGGSRSRLTPQPPIIYIYMGAFSLFVAQVVGPMLPATWTFGKDDKAT